jgi:hypothetical protein
LSWFFSVLRYRHWFMGSAFDLAVDEPTQI